MKLLPQHRFVWVPWKRAEEESRPLRSSWGGSAAWLRLTADSIIIDDLIEKQREEEEGEHGGGEGNHGREERGRRAPMKEKFTYSFSAQSRSWGHWCERRGFSVFTRTSFPPVSHPHARSTPPPCHLSSLARASAFLFLLSPPFLWMILSRKTCTSLSSDTARPPHIDTSLLKFKRHQDFHCSFRRTLGKYHSTRKNLILCAAAAAEATVDMSLKADAEPNNNVSIEEEVSFCRLRPLEVDSQNPDLVFLNAEKNFLGDAYGKILTLPSESCEVPLYSNFLPNRT